jgi:hypothetical protein
MDHQAKLFHVLVVIGAGMTGSLGACSAGVNPQAEKDAAADGDYAHIVYFPPADGSACPTQPCYGNISIDAQAAPVDGYAHIAAAETGVAPDSGEAG